MGQTAIFVDGGYFDRVSRDCGSPRIDFGKLATELSRPDDLLRTYYYHCLPYMSPVPTPEEEERYAGKQRFFSALNRLNRFEVREGKLEYRGTDRESNRPIFEQKRVDIYLGVDLVMLAVKQRIHRAILITGDSDFLPAIRAAKNEGVLIHLFHGTGPQQPHRDLWEEADDRTVITPDLLNTFLLSERPQQEPRGEGGGFERHDRGERPERPERTVFERGERPVRTPRPTYTSPSSYARETYPSGRGWPEGLPVVDEDEEA
ncbi:NYN domain-containing protein [Longimicrobium sp.]|uniref:NYN domain-containing protein n=1 Tax=Longimicrobium sp. TaxID=2029185 RepID=UPI002D0924BA|nr:NYN domain-containing protein [Longimicrobium sp.]HSU15318.1 NYN domain-containing protein [Longimicrobium sp.]